MKRFLNSEAYNIFTFGRPPMAIDIVTSIQGVNFKDAIQNIKNIEVQGLSVSLLGMSDLIATKKASNRYKDLDDLENLNLEDD